MKVVHEAGVFELYPAHATGVIRLRPVDSAAVEVAVRTLAEAKPSPSVDEAVQRWDRVYRNMGTRQAYRSSLAQLLQKFKEGGRLSFSQPLVHLYNAVSLTIAVPMAGYDVRHIVGDLRLTANTRDHRGLAFSPLNHPKDRQRLRSGEVAYVDDEKIVCRYWNWGDCDETRLQDDTSDALFVFDLIDEPPGTAEAVFEDIAARCRTWFGADTVTTGVATRDAYEVEIDA